MAKNRRHSERRYETVQHPKHYGGDVAHEIWKCLNAWGLEKKALLWTAVCYIGRAGIKPGSDYLEDLRKARWYLQREIDNEKLRRKGKEPWKMES